MLPPTVENRTDRNTAVPSVPPIWRKNSDDDVATPMSRTCTAFCTASTSGCMVKPSPSPNSTETEKTNGSVVPDSRRREQQRAGAMRMVPTTGNILYRPVREVVWPAMIEPAMMPSVKGMSVRPASVGVWPLTICR